MTIEGASPLHQQLFAAIEGRNAQQLNTLLARHWDEIAAQFDSWARVPAAIRDDRQAASRYVQSVVAIAQVLEAAGEPSFLQRLVGPDETNPIVRWNRRLANAQALAEEGEYGESTAQLEALLAELADARGTAVVNLLPKIYGRLGTNALQANDFAAAVEYTRRAYDASVAAHDAEDRDSYYENLMSLRTLALLRDDAERGQRLLRIRRLLARAQQSADAGRYAASKQTLVEALALLEADGTHELFEAHMPKAYGLLGFNEWRLGDAEAARAHTATALEKSRRAGDAEGVRIYTESLAALNADRTPPESARS